MGTISKIIRQAAIGGILLLFSACSITHKPYNHGFSDRIVETVHHNGQTAKIGYLEFDDMGELWRIKGAVQKGNGAGTAPALGDGSTGGSTQLGTVLDALREQVKKGPVHLIVYAHGWNNNAKATNPNRVAFTEVIKAAALAKADKNTTVFGVYFGWKGKTLDYADYYNRDAAAARIGRVQATGALQALCTTAQLHPKSRVVAVGHSMGAVILLRAIAQPLSQEIAVAAVQQRASREGLLGGKKALKVERAMADTVVLVNTADNGILARQLVGMLADFETSLINPKTKRRLPLITSVTSTGDWATGKIFDKAGWVARYPLGWLMPHASGRSSSPAQEKATTTALGFYEPIHNAAILNPDGSKAFEKTTHKHGYEPKADNLFQAIRSNATLQQTRGSEHTVEEARKGREWASIPLSLNPTGVADLSAPPKPYFLAPGSIGQMNNQTPFWILQVPQFMIWDHNEIWTPNFVGLVSALEAAGRIAKDGVKLKGPGKTQKKAEPRQERARPQALPDRDRQPAGDPPPLMDLTPSTEPAVSRLLEQIQSLPAPDLSAPSPELKLRLPE